MTATVQIIALDGVKILKTTSLTDAQGVNARALIEAVRKARELIRFTEGGVNVRHVSGTLDEYHPLTIKALLARLAEILDHTYKPRLAAQPRDGAGSGVEVFHSPAPVPVAIPVLSELFPYGDYLQHGRNFGLLLVNENQPFDRVELIGVGGSSTLSLRWR